MLVSCFQQKCSKTMFFVGLFQLLLAPMFVGYFLSIYWGYLIVKKAFSDSVEFQTFLNNANAKSDAPPSGINIGGGS